jgi:hypothetical protein
MTDRKLNDYIDVLISTPRHERIASAGQWAAAFDSAMAMWVDRHPGTRPPAFAKMGPPPSCFSGTIPPLYDGKLE